MALQGRQTAAVFALNGKGYAALIGGKGPNARTGAQGIFAVGNRIAILVQTIPIK